MTTYTIILDDAEIEAFAKATHCTVGYVKHWLGLSDDSKKLEPFQKVLVRDENDEVWNAGIFSHYATGDDTFGYRTLDGGCWVQCIPYEGNESKLGTTN